MRYPKLTEERQRVREELVAVLVGIAIGTGLTVLVWACG